MDTELLPSVLEFVCYIWSSEGKVRRKHVNVFRSALYIIFLFLEKKEKVKEMDSYTG